MKKCVVSFSGGKDSTTMLLMLLESGAPVDQVVFADTTLEYPGMLDYIYMIQDHIKRKIIITKPSCTFDSWCLGTLKRGKRKGRIRGLPPVLYPCYWNREAILKPTLPYTRGNYVYIGITSDESHRAKPKPYFTATYPLVLNNISSDFCLSYLSDRALLNPLYNHMNRTGCWLCPKQSISSLRYLFFNYPLLWTQLKLYTSVSFEFSPCLSLDDLEKRFILENH